MATYDLEQFTHGNDTYVMRDASAVHTVDSALSSSSTNPVQNKVVYSALKNQPHFEYVMTSGDLQPTNFSGTFPTTFSALVSHADFKIALRNPVIVHYTSLTGSDDFITQGLLWFGVNTQITDEWTILFPDGVTFQGALTNGVTGTMSYDSSDQIWYLDGVTAHTPGYKTYTDDAIAAIPAGSDTTYTFTGGTQSFTATPSQGTAQSVSIKPQIFKGNCATAAATATKVVTCPEFTSSDLVTGAVILVKFTNKNSAAVANLKLNVNSTGAKAIKYERNGSVGNLPGTGYLLNNMTYRFVYNGSYWVCDCDYDSEIAYRIRHNSSSKEMAELTYRYRLLFTSADNSKWVPANSSTATDATALRTVTTSRINPFGEIVCYNSTTEPIAVGSIPSASSLYDQVTATLGYSFNRTGSALSLTYPAPVYLKCTPYSDGSVQIDPDTPYVQALPTAADNKVYIFLGYAYSATAIELIYAHPVYYFKLGVGNIPWPGYDLTLPSDLERTTNKVTSFGPAATDTEYPSAKAVYDELPAFKVFTSDPYYGFTLYQEPPSYGFVWGYVSQGVYDTFANIISPQSGKAKSIIIIDDAGLLDHSSSGAIKTFYLSDFNPDDGIITLSYGGDSREYCGPENLFIISNDDFRLVEPLVARHWHGNILDGGSMSDASSQLRKTIATGDMLPIVDAANGNLTNMLATSTVTFDTTDTSKFFRHDGTWASPVDSLDTTISGLGTGKTITALSETNGVISASASNIAIDASQVTTGTFPTNRLLRPVQLNAAGIQGDLTVASQVDAMRANRLAFLPAKNVIVEQTTDGGTTWVDAGVADSIKRHVFAGTRGSYFVLPKIDGVRNVNCGLRVTFTAMNYNVPDGTTETNKYQYWNSTYVASAERYTQLREFYFFCSAVNDGISCKVEAATGANPNTWTTLYDSGTTFALTGWSGQDYIRLNGSQLFGGGTNQTGNYWNYRMTFFTRDSNGGTNLSTSSTTSSQQIFQIQGYGPTSWTNPNNMMFKDHLYNWDENKNATFPAAVTATGGLRGPGTAYFGTCSTAAATGDKVVTCEGFVLQDGARIAIKFSNGNSATGAIRLNVNSTGLKTIICRGSSSVSYNPVMKIGSADVLEFIYNGSNYILLDGFRIRELATSSTRLTSANMSISGGGLEYFNATSSMTTGKPPGDAHVLGMHWDNGELWTSQLAISNASARIFTRAQNSGTWQPWREAPLFATNPTPGQVVVADTSSFADDCQVKGVTLNVDGANFDGTNPVKHYGLTTLYSNGVFSIIDANYNNTLAQGFRMTINVAYDMSYDTGLKMNIRTSGTDVPGSGDKFIKRNGEIIKSLTAGEVLEFVYDGTDWQQVGGSGGDADVAEQLGEEVDVSDNVPYIYRPTGGDVLTGTSKYETLVGGTVAWNQLRSGAFPAACTHSISNGIITITPTSSSNRYIACDPNGSSYTPVIKDHVYLESVVIKSDGTNSVGFQNYQYLNVTKKTTSSTWTVLADIKKASASGNSVVQLYSPSQTVYYIKESSFRLYDLTLMFGPTIANQLLSMETSTAGAGVQWFRDLFPSDYYPYNTGELLSVMPTAEKSAGFNLFDKTKIVTGYTNDGTGALINTGAGVNYKSTDFIHVVGGKTYYIKTDQVGSAWGAWYDASKKYISGITGYAHGNIYQEQTAPIGACYMRLTCYVNTPDGNIDTFCVSISDSSKNGTYEPYKESTYPITPVELRGIPKLDSNNKLYYDGDIRNSDGTVTRKYGIVDLGSRSWSKQNESGFYTFYTTAVFSDAKLSAVICAKYAYNSANSHALLAEKEVTWFNTTDRQITIRDTSYADADAFKTAMSGVYLVYELASPTYEEVAAFPNPQVVDPYGVEEFVDERTVAIPVGHESRYVTNLREKLEEAPSVPVDDGKYVVEIKNGVSNYVRETVKVYRTTDPDFTITKDATPSSGSLYSGSVTDYTYDQMLADYQNGVIPMIVDDASILDPDEAFTFKFVSFYEDGDRFSFECDDMEFRLYNQNDFKVYTKDYKSSSVPFYSCSTAIDTAAKLVYGSGFDLAAGARIYVKFTNGNTANQPTLNINDTGGKYIMSGGQYLRSTGLGTSGVGCYINPGAVLELIYDGTYWNVLDLRNQLFATNGYNRRLTDLNRSYSMPSLEYLLATSSTTNGKPRADGKVLQMNWDNSTVHASQLAVGRAGDYNWIQVRTQTGNGTNDWNAWQDVAMQESGTCTLTDGMSISFTANYFKMGRQVTVWGTIPKYASTALGLSGLPYAASASMTSVVQFQNPASGGAMVSATLSVAAGYTTLGTIGYITGSSNNGMFVGNSTGTWLNLIPSTGLSFNFTYITDTP